MDIAEKIRENLDDFLYLVNDKDSIIKPVVVNKKVYGFAVWYGGHRIYYYTRNFQKSATVDINENIIPVTYKDFLKAVEELARWVKLSEEELDRRLGIYKGDVIK